MYVPINALGQKFNEKKTDRFYEVCFQIGKRMCSEDAGRESLRIRPMTWMESSRVNLACRNVHEILRKNFV
ncbi:hypothetical protein [Paenibacillus ihumii]|uniref:hypothetical protein n=1 Tax=Paenibacillus ihumii TaxID=687436 RepID=UPI0006D7FD9B|nr:hypothetical protein [Paenibacillus ihumii]